MRRSLLVVGVVLSGWGTSSSAAAADVLLPDFAGSIVMLTSPRARDYHDGVLVAETIRELRRASPTFDEMLKTMAASRIVTFIRTSQAIGQENGLIGRTRFIVGPAKTVAMSEVVPSREDIHRRREAVAHELAHVVEVACFGPLPDEEALYQRLRTQVPRFRSAGRGRLLETRFAERVARVVLGEAKNHGGGVSQLARLALREGLLACPTPSPSVEGLMIARSLESLEEETGREH